MQQRNALLRAQPRQCRFELQRLVNCFLHERFDGLFAPRSERAAAKSTSETLYPREADTVYFSGFPVQDRDTPVDENLPDLLWLSAFEIMVAKHRDDGHLQRRIQLADENARFVGQTIVGKVTAQQQHIRGPADLAEQRLKRPLRVLRHMQVAHGGDPQGAPSWSVGHAQALYSNEMPVVS